MRKRCLLLFLPLLLLALASTSHAWQGRMGGMGDPFGLVADESDYLIHPAKIANGEGVRFYGDYRFTYTGVTDWDYALDVYNTSGTLIGFYHYDTSGQEYKHNALLGAALPLGPGRAGLFFEYAGKRGDYDGAENIFGTPSFATYNLRSDFDNFALRLLYGLPVGSFKLGGEVQFAYRQEKNETSWQGLVGVAETYLNQYFGPLQPYSNLSPFLFPYDSSHWEALFKGSLEGKVGPLDLEFTLRGGFLFGSDNQLKYEAVVGPGTYAYDLNGGANGWRIGSDFWVRYPVSDTLSVPLLVRLDYQEKTRDGQGMGGGVYSGSFFEYENKERGFEIEVGGGVDKEIDKDTRIAAGIYYSYLDKKDDFQVVRTPAGFWQVFDHSDYPASIEHRVRLSLAGERKISPAVTLRLGINGFYGWVQEGLKYTYTLSTLPLVERHDIALAGSHWGIGASAGGSVRFQHFTLEPFVAASYEELALDGNGDFVPSAGLPALYDMDSTRRAWNVGGGLSVLFSL
jgi:hypothetical protein